jgi:ADP-ribose pyrophosphatase
VALPEPPKVELEVVRDRTGEAKSGFLDVRRLDLVAKRGSSTSATFAYDILARRALDACVMVAHHEANGRLHVWLRTAIRPPVVLRPIEPRHLEALWEVPAGLVEPGESPRAAAARELEEELGFSVAEEALEPLGPWSVPAPGFIGELHHYFHVRVDPSRRREPVGDGSPLEEAAQIVAAPLDELLADCRSGVIRDAKTELALRRLADEFPP